MSDQSQESPQHRTPNVVIWLTITLGAIGLGLWWWVNQNLSSLPSPESKPGRALLRQYQVTVHDIWLILLVISLGYLINRIYTYTRRESLNPQEKPRGPIESMLGFIRNNPITSIIFIAYTVAMITGTTYIYKDMVGWYPDLVQGHFLDNFSIRGSFIDETMRRSDYRFFPLAHQDLHILSWFTIHIKTWMLFSAAELIGIVVLITKFLNGLQLRETAQQSTILLITCLLLIHPSTGTTFFHVIYCERLLCLVFMLYATSYVDYRRTGKTSKFYLTFLWALLGIYIKDIAILLFIIPAASLWLTDNISRHNDQNNIISQNLSSQRNKLEKWICSLTLIFSVSYIFLALIPSSYAAEGAYNEDAAYKIILDFRFYIFAIIASTRIALILRHKITFNLLDAINVAGFAYAAALGITYEFDASSYLSLPFQLIATINIGWVWIQTIELNRGLKAKPGIKVAGAALASSMIVGIDHATAKNTFLNNISEQKFEQAYIQSTYEELYKISRKIRESGDDVNIIINQKSRLSAKRHLNRIPYKSLIEYEPDRDQFIVKDGAGKMMLYTPKVGDIVANLDKSTELLNPILENIKTELIYRHNPSQRSGLILRITGIES
ncbi:hypothetical protein [Synechococcus sp. MIT S9503]|uniref:hypothetical protein n=1 Tax=Synechococcus sp. MIT S9503 TaxID=3082547 RepID=UPI0039A506E7